MRYARLYMAVALIAVILIPERALSKDTDDHRFADVEGPVSMMFAQSAESMTFDGSTLTLKGLAPATVFFSERPNRLVGHLTTAEFVELWSQGADSFKADPPNAAISILGDSKTPPAVIEIKNVALDGDALKYSVRVLDGTLPKTGGAVSLFIDPWVYVPPRRVVPPPLRRPRIRCHWSYYWHRRVCRRVY